MRVCVLENKGQRNGERDTNVLVVEMLEKTDLAQQPCRVSDVLERVRHLLDGHVAAAPVLCGLDSRAVSAKRKNKKKAMRRNKEELRKGDQRKPDKPVGTGADGLDGAVAVVHNKADAAHSVVRK